MITGIAGFLGAHIAREALAAGWEVTGIDNLLGGTPGNVPEGVTWLQADCLDRGWEYLARDADVLFHCAAAPYEGLSVFSPALVYRNTLQSTVNTLVAALNGGVRRFVFCSSMSRYGDNPLPFTEDQPVNPVDPYAEAKVAAERAVERLCGLHGMEWVIAVPHNIYGPLQRYWDPYRNVAAIMVNRVLRGRPPIVYGDGSQRRCLSYITDVTGPLLKLATADVAGEVINIGPGDEGCTISFLAAEVMRICGMTGEPEFFPPRPAEVPAAYCSDEKARKLLDYRPLTGLQEGLGNLVGWIRETGPREFEYHLPLEIVSADIPETWSRQLM